MERGGFSVFLLYLLSFHLLLLVLFSGIFTNCFEEFVREIYGHLFKTG